MRRDIPLADQIVQAGHAAFEAGQRWHEIRETCHLVLLAVPGESDLLNLARRCAERGIECVTFYEPDDGMGHTALCTQPVDLRQRGLFRRYPMWS